MGVYGFLNANYYLEDLEPFFITAGTFAIPSIGGVGLGWKQNYNRSKFSIFNSLSTVGIYILPTLCSTDNCDTKFDMLLSASAGIEMAVLKRKKFDLYFQFGIISQYSIFNQVIDESPSDIPSIWPIINLKIIN